MRERVTLVVVAELLARDRERQTGLAPGEQIDVPERAAVHLQVSLDDRPPCGPVPVECLASFGVELDQALVRETGLR